MKEKIISAISYLWVLFFLPLVLIPQSSFGRFHANQALINLIWGVVGAILAKIVGFIPLIGWLLAWLIGVLIAVFPIWGIVCALLGLKKPFPFTESIKLI